MTRQNKYELRQNENVNTKLIKQSLIGASMITVGANLIGRFLGFLREATVASYFGTSEALDTFILAFTIPELVSFIIFSALPTAIIPWLAEHKLDGTESDRRPFMRGLIIFGLIFGSLSVLIFLLRQPLLSFLAPRLEGDQIELGLTILSLLSGFVFFRGVESYFRGWMHARKHFIIPATSPFWLNVAVLGSVFFLYGKFEIVALAIGWLIGSILLFIVHGLFVIKILNFKSESTDVDPAIKGLLQFVLSVAIVEAISLAYPIIDRMMAARWLGEGQIAALRYASFLSSVPPGILIVTISLASYPWITEYSMNNENIKLRLVHDQTLKLIAFMVFVVTPGMALFSSDLIRIAFERGSFDGSSVELCAGPFRYYSLGLAFYSIYIYQMRFYFARKATKALGIILLSMLMIKIISSIILIEIFEHEGLAIGTAIAWVSGFIIMSFDLKRRASLDAGSIIAKMGLRLAPSIVIALLIWYGLIFLWPLSVSASLWWQAGRLTLVGTAGVLAYFVTAHLCGVREPLALLNIVRERFGRSQGGQL